MTDLVYVNKINYLQFKSISVACVYHMSYPDSDSGKRLAAGKGLTL